MTQQNRSNKAEHSSKIFHVLNYKLLALGLFLVIVGFTAMYLENEVSGFISLFVSPIVIMVGYITVIFAIMVRPSQANSTESSNVN